MAALTYDEFLTNHLGEFGRYQIFVFILLSLVGIPTCCVNVGIVFLSATPEHWCRTSGLQQLGLSEEQEKNLTIPYDGDEYESCDKYSRVYNNWTTFDVNYELALSRDNLSTIECDDGWRYSDQFYDNTIVNEWDLVCDRRWLRATAAAVFQVGVAVGVVVTASLSDAFGRKPVMCACITGLTIAATINCFAVSYAMFIAVRFFIGFFAIAVTTVQYVMLIEIVGPDWRSFVGLMSELFWVLGYCLLPGLAYYLRDWQQLHASFAVLCAPFLLYFCLLPESPRWLYVRQRTDEADHLVRKIARVNKKTLPEKFQVVAKQEEKTGYIWDLFRTPRLRLRTLNTIFIWCVVSLVYYGLSLTSTDLSGNPFLNVFLSGIVELPAYLLSVPALTYIGRRRSLSLSMLLAGLALLLTLAVPDDNDNATTGLVLVGKFSISAAFGIVYVVTAEVFPTAVRNVGLSAGSFGGRVGSIVSPYIGQLSDYGEAIPIIIFGACAAAAGVTSMFLPETKGVTLPETLEDGENFGKKEKKLPKETMTVEVNGGFTNIVEAEPDNSDNLPHTKF